MSAASVLAGRLLVGCGDSTAGAAGSILIGTPENPVKQPFFDDVPPIESGLEPEAGPLRLYNWEQYIFQQVVKDFEKEYGVDVEVTTFYNIEEATRKLRSGEVSYDVFFPTAEIIPKFIAGKLFQPLNHDYIPNLAETVLPQLADPYYDKKSRYTAPYTIYQTGIGWRADMVSEDISQRENPWDVFWDPAYKDIVGLYDDHRETLGVGLYRNGITDINTDDAGELEKASLSLIELVDLVNVRYTIDGAYSGLPEGKFGIHHSWSGDVVNAQFYFPEGEPTDTIRYVWPPKSKGGPSTGGYVSNDSLGILRNAQNPVLAHHFLDFMLRDEVAAKNFSWLGYQPPLKSINPESLVADGFVPPELSSAVIVEDDFQIGQAPIQLDAETGAEWLIAWSTVQSSG